MAEEVKSGEWYLGVRCDKCETLIPLFHDSSGGKTKFAGPGQLQVTCPNPQCRLESDYSTGEVLHIRAEQKH